MESDPFTKGSDFDSWYKFNKPHVKIRPFLASNGKVTGSRPEMDRTFAARYVAQRTKSDRPHSPALTPSHSTISHSHTLTFIHSHTVSNSHSHTRTEESRPGVGCRVGAVALPPERATGSHNLWLDPRASCPRARTVSVRVRLCESVRV